MQVISVDCGRSGVKAVSAHERVYFPATLGTWRQLRNGREMGVEDLVIDFAGERYFGGRVAIEEAEDGAQMMTAYKAHLDTKILTLAALHRLVTDDEPVMLVTGLPLAFHNDHDKQRMRELLLGTHTIGVHGVTKTIHIERVEVAAEGATAAWSIAQRRPGRFHVLDVGSRTVNYATAVDGRWRDRESDSLDYGFETFRGTEEQFARVVISDLSTRLRPLGLIVLVGGRGSLLPHLRQYHANVELHPDALFANAVAFRELGVIAHARQHTQAETRQ
ncbi:hypothetical protein Alches_23100 [Alicyclobacillus hesperidum subsp. aegles]|uniref:ParM/StbA family protein n=1 Tax=Alicyclobacillus hesperidum TaxID=89784 RepID=UPI00222A5BAE|nr:ParM/StbA family protein [Alicyclobacillus hesperidum]GLG02269.1 hypothetical protein Alches_23100 [Alicyclobacillus hesperidum subsp. aegles]